MSKLTYWQKLKDPRWQRKRLDVMKREEFTCELCGSKERTLNVHHGYYRKAADPWEYETDTLHCLCEECHEDIQNLTAEIQRAIAFIPIGKLSSILGIMATLVNFDEATISKIEMDVVEMHFSDITEKADAE